MQIYIRNMVNSSAVIWKRKLEDFICGNLGVNLKVL